MLLYFTRTENHRILNRRKALLFAALLLPILMIVLANALINENAKGKTFSDPSQIPPHKVGLVLGTAKYLTDGQMNLYFKYRIQAAVQLFKAGKVEFILVSGDNSSRYYDEPNTFRNELIKKGIPANKIYRDYAGFRTLDSVVRAKEIFSQEEFIIISQEFHNARAIYLAEAHGLKAIGYNAKDVPAEHGVKTEIREYLARVKVFFDLLFGIEPKFLGEKVEIK